MAKPEFGGANSFSKQRFGMAHTAASGSIFAAVPLRA